MDKITQQKIKEAKQLLEQYAPKGEFLAYINKKEARILKAYGGAGKPIKQTNIPSYFIFTASGALASWVVPALIATSTAVSFMGSLNQSRNMRRAMLTDERNAQNRANQLKDIANMKAAKRLSTLRTIQAASGTQMGTGSNLLQTVEQVKEIEKAQYYASQNLQMELDAIDSRGSSLLAQEAYSRGTNLLGGGFQFAKAGQESGLFKGT